MDADKVIVVLPRFNSNDRRAVATYVAVTRPRSRLAVVADHVHPVRSWFERHPVEIPEDALRHAASVLEQTHKP